MSMSADAELLPDPSEGAIEPPPVPTVLLRATRHSRRLDDWALVLVARGMHPISANLIR